MNNQEMTLFAFGGIVDEAIAKVYAISERKSDSGAVSQSVKRASRKDIAKAHNLVANKENKKRIDNIMLAASDGLKVKLGQMVATVTESKDWTGYDVRMSRSKNGKIKLNFIYEKVDRTAALMSVAEIASRIGKTETEVEDMIKRQEAILEEAEKQQKIVDAAAAPVAETATNEHMSDEDKAAQAALEAEEAARQAAIAESKEQGELVEA